MRIDVGFALPLQRYATMCSSRLIRRTNIRLWFYGKCRLGPSFSWIHSERCKERHLRLPDWTISFQNESMEPSDHLDSSKSTWYHFSWRQYLQCGWYTNISSGPITLPCLMAKLLPSNQHQTGTSNPRPLKHVQRHGNNYSFATQ